MLRSKAAVQRYPAAADATGLERRRPSHSGASKKRAATLLLVAAACLWLALHLVPLWQHFGPAEPPPLNFIWTSLFKSRHLAADLPPLLAAFLNVAAVEGQTLEQGQAAARAALLEALHQQQHFEAAAGSPTSTPPVHLATLHPIDAALQQRRQPIPLHTSYAASGAEARQLLRHLPRPLARARTGAGGVLLTSQPPLMGPLIIPAGGPQQIDHDVEVQPTPALRAAALQLISRIHTLGQIQTCPPEPELPSPNYPTAQLTHRDPQPTVAPDNSSGTGRGSSEAIADQPQPLRVFIAANRKDSAPIMPNRVREG